ncbi:MAG: PAS domain-containing protein [Spirochaetales bacterium]|nr:PAS domain-containing protein [Spirochaetales bacterium]
MGICSVLLLIVFFLILFGGVYVLILDTREKTYRLFFLMALLIAIWSLIAFLAFIAESEEVLWRRFKIGMVPTILLIPTILYFVISLTGGYIDLWAIVLIYAVSIPLHYVNWNSILFFDRAIREGFTWRLHPDFGSPWMYYWLAYYNCIIGASLHLLCKWKKKIHSYREKREANTIFILLSIFVFIGIISDYVVLPLLNLPLLGPVYFIVFLAGTYYAIMKFRFFSITPMTVDRNILQNIDIIIILLDETGKIILINKKAEVSLGIQDISKYLNEDIDNFFKGTARLKVGISRLLKRRRVKFSCFLKSTSNGVSKTINVSVSPVRDRNDVLGILLVGNEVLGVRDFIEEYHISMREWETIQYLLLGMSNKRIARFMKISERTVKAHINHIYTKLGIASRVRLLNILRRFNILPPLKNQRGKRQNLSNLGVVSLCF